MIKAKWRGIYAWATSTANSRYLRRHDRVAHSRTKSRIIEPVKMGWYDLIYFDDQLFID